ncbi:winged helix-turn-helix transcriptional regulator [Hydrogenivirga sp. 128-5-R1-1]|uniref:winged helix-turn-helix transcriptional regulator n=1 Tax=Hydrogenivirga sp. 128-5-R1-1 TaxID=392423 RepID=UPI00015F0CC4|nr:winged helix-turn-helix transcriptional regulator [Hydrogenivirga sp. 128-5-R1-1]EDP75866.1 transcriptional regulator, HxlR family protein [Hydrogenivirga sp. 128-5-R1-1]
MGRSLLTCKWALQIVMHLADSPRRPSELLRLVKGIEERVLFDRLKRLTAVGVVNKIEKDGYPKETFYYLVNPEELKPICAWLRSMPIPVEKVVAVMSCRWTLEIMDELDRELSPKMLKEALPGLTDKVLHARLRELEDLGLVQRTVLPTKPVRVIYRLTEKGIELRPLLKRMKELILYRGRTRSQASSPVHGS